MSPTTDFDMHSPELPTSWPEIFREFRTECPVAHSDLHGGFWVLSRYQDIWGATRRDDVFSNRNDVDEASDFKGVCIPPNFTRSGMHEMERSSWSQYRKLLNPFFAPAAVKEAEARTLEITTWAIDNVIEGGTIDFVDDLGSPVPSIVTIEILGVPFDSWRAYANAFHQFVYVRKPSVEFDAVIAEVSRLMAELDATVTARRDDPRDDVITFLTTAEVEGKRLSNPAILEQLFPLLAAGVDTTTNLLANAMLHLSRNPALRQHLIEEPQARQLVTEEFLRFYSPLPGLARTVTQDWEVDGQVLKAGERAWLLFASANRDEGSFPNPDEFVPDRFPNRHLAFGAGIHRCIGSHLARMEFRIMMDEILERLPDFEVTESKLTRYPTIALINGYVSLPATFTPGKRQGPRELARRSTPLANAT